MRTTPILLAAIALALPLFAACGDDDSPKPTPTSPAAAGQTAAASVVARPLKDVLTEAINEEYKAHATYQAVIEKPGNVAPFSNIVASEQQHIDAWKSLLAANKLDVPPDTFIGQVTAPATLKEACTVGVAAEKEDIAMYDRLQKETTDAAALTVMAQQRKVSQESHLPAFEKCN